jgi:hypothetical protein
VSKAGTVTAQGRSSDVAARPGPSTFKYDLRNPAQLSISIGWQRKKPHLYVQVAFSTEPNSVLLSNFLVLVAFSR